MASAGEGVGGRDVIGEVGGGDSRWKFLVVQAMVED